MRVDAKIDIVAALSSAVHVCNVGRCEGGPAARKLIGPARPAAGIFGGVSRLNDSINIPTQTNPSILAPVRCSYSKHLGRGGVSDGSVAV